MRTPLQKLKTRIVFSFNRGSVSFSCVSTIFQRETAVKKISTTSRFALAAVIALASSTAVSAQGLAGYDAAIAADNGGSLPYTSALTESVSFDGSDSAAFDFGAASDTGDATIEFIVSGDPVAGERNGYLGAGENSTFSLRYEQWDDTGQLGFTHGGVADYVFDPPVESPTEPTHLAYRWDNTAEIMDLYVNGALAGSQTAPAFEMPMGEGLIGNVAGGTEGTVGTFDRITVYDTALDPAIIGNHAAAFSSGPMNNSGVRQYTANFTSSPPAIDGVLGAGEWDAAPSAGDWEVIRTPRMEDDENNRFRVLWDQQGIYLLGESDYDFWADDINGQNPAASDLATGDFFNFFLDPNTLGEDNIGQLDEEIDNYQIGFNLHEGSRSCGGDRIAGTEDDCTQEPNPEEPLATDGVSVTGSTFGTLTAAHVDGLFNNASEWEHLRGTHISWTAGEDGAVAEMFIPWEEFDAPAVTSEENGSVETGLNHPFAPSNGDVWIFNATRQSSEPSNLLPQWNWTSSLFFASHGNEGAEGHGELIFAGAPDAPSFLPADFDESGTVDFADFLLLSEAFGTEVPAGTVTDIDGSGTVDFPDFLVLSNSFGQSAAASVPEPTSLGLMMFGVMALGLARRRRS